MAVPAKSVLDHTSLEAIAREVAQLLGRDDPLGAHGLLSARQVAARFSVARSWVYAHADELGVIRLGHRATTAHAIRPRRGGSTPPGASGAERGRAVHFGRHGRCATPPDQAVTANA
jgi:hypothetical protein